MPGHRRTPAGIKNTVAQFHESGLSRREFAKRHDIGASSLAHWLHHQPQAWSPTKFVRVVPATAPTAPS